MESTQIYLTKEERDGLESIAKSTGKKQSELIREAIDQFLDLNKENQREAILNEVAGMWKNRDDLPDFSELRRSWGRD